MENDRESGAKTTPIKFPQPSCLPVSYHHASHKQLHALNSRGGWPLAPALRSRPGKKQRSPTKNGRNQLLGSSQTMKGTMGTGERSEKHRSHRTATDMSSKLREATCQKARAVYMIPRTRPLIWTNESWKPKITMTQSISGLCVPCGLHSGRLYCRRIHQTVRDERRISCLAADNPV